MPEVLFLMNTHTKVLKDEDKDSFGQASLKNRALIILSGPLANLLLGLFLITCIFYFNGKYVSSPIINNVK